MLNRRSLHTAPHRISGRHHRVTGAQHAHRPAFYVKVAGIESSSVKWSHILYLTYSAHSFTQEHRYDLTNVKYDRPDYPFGEAGRLQPCWMQALSRKDRFADWETSTLDWLNIVETMYGTLALFTRYGYQPVAACTRYMAANSPRIERLKKTNKRQKSK